MKSLLVVAREKAPGVWHCHSRAAGAIVVIAQPRWQFELGIGWTEELSAMVRAACSERFGMRPSAVRLRVLPLVTVDAEAAE